MPQDIIFIPGWSFNAGVWQRQKEYFSLLGFNTFFYESDDLDNVVRNIDLSRVIFAVWSLGWYKLLVALRNARVLPKAIIGVSCGITFNRSLLRLVMRNFNKNPTRLLLDFDSWLFSKKEKTREEYSLWQDFILRYRINDNDKLLRDLIFLEKIDASHILPDPKITVFLISGSGDTISSPQEALKLKGRLPKSECCMFDCGHAPFLTEEKEFNRIVLEFLGRVR